MSGRNTYYLVGTGLLVTGSLVALVSFFILHITWLTALGISMLILSFISLMLGRTIPRISPEVSSLLLETGINNLAALVEEIGITSKAYYLPSSLTGGSSKALIPLHDNASLAPITGTLPQRLIVKYGVNPDDVGLLVTTTGTAAISLLETMPGPVSAELESALISLFRGVLGVAERTRVITDENRINIEIYNPRIENRTTWSHQCLGGPLTSIVASVAAEAWNKPVTITREEHHRGIYSIELEVLS